MSINNKEAIEHFLDTWEKNIELINDACSKTFFLRAQEAESEEDILALIEGLFAIDYVVARTARSLDVGDMKDAGTFDLTRQHGIVLEAHLEALSEHIEKYAVRLGNDDVVFERTGQSVFGFDYKSKYEKISKSSSSALHQLVLAWDDIRYNFYSILGVVISESWPALAEHVEDKYVFCQTFYTPSCHFYIANGIDTTDEGTALIVQMFTECFK